MTFLAEMFLKENQVRYQELNLLKARLNQIWLERLEECQVLGIISSARGLKDSQGQPSSSFSTHVLAN